MYIELSRFAFTNGVRDALQEIAWEIADVGAEALAVALAAVTFGVTGGAPGRGFACRRANVAAHAGAGGCDGLGGGWLFCTGAGATRHADATAWRSPGGDLAWNVRGTDRFGGPRAYC